MPDPSELRALAPTGNLGHSPIQVESFRAGLARDPHFIAADAGSGDIGPSFLGANARHHPEDWDLYDLRLLLPAAREQGIPLIIGSAGGAGTNRGVDHFVDMIRRVSAELGVRPFRLASIYSDVSKDDLRDRLATGEEIPGLGAMEPLDEVALDATDHVVAMMGVEPIMKALEMGAEVVVAGRACDDALFAALPLLQGYPKGLALHFGKCLECASLVARPSMVKETILGTLRQDAFLLEPMHPGQACTPDAVGAHSMYERVDPYTQAIPGGVLDMHECRFQAVDARVCRVTGSRFIADSRYRVKLEGSGRVGFRAFSIVGIRDPFAIGEIDAILADVRTRVARDYAHLLEGRDYRLHFHVYGRNGVMGALEPQTEVTSHELGIVTEVVTPEDQELAMAIAKLVQYRFLFARYPGQKSSGGGAALIVDEALRGEQAAYRWTMDHLLTVEDPLELFPIRLRTIGGP